MKAKTSVKLFILSFVPYVIALLYGIYRAFAGVEYFNTVYGAEGFALGVIDAALTMCYIPVIPLCLVCQIAFILRRKVKAVKELSQKKYEVIVRIAVALVAATVILSVYKLDTRTFYEKHYAKEMLEVADEKIAYYTSQKHKSVIFGIDDITTNTLLIDYDEHEVGVITYSGHSEFWKVTLEKTEAGSDVLQHIEQDYYQQSEIPLSSPGSRLLSYSKSETWPEDTIAFIMEMADGSVYYIDNIKGDDTNFEPFSALNHLD